MTAKSVLMRP